jgi:hypothetical protein
MIQRYRYTLLVLALIAAYLAGTATLAITINRGFFLNDAVAIAVWTVFGLALLISSIRMSNR